MILMAYVASLFMAFLLLAIIQIKIHTTETCIGLKQIARCRTDLARRASPLRQDASRCAARRLEVQRNVSEFSQLNVVASRRVSV
uniref:Secreted protein n=1 Tax=Heliothis virescens TaxID=7102 RepID=A0A2A4ITB3_HELVI